MNQELTQRVIGAVVVTALAAIFIPMLFEDPVDNGGQVVNNLQIPEQQFPGENNQVPALPNNAEEVTAPDEAELEIPAENATDSSAESEPAPESSLSDQEMMAEPPADTDIDEEQEFTPTVQATTPKPSKAPAETVKPRPTPAPAAASKTKKTPAKPATINKTPTTSQPPVARGEINKAGLKRWYIQAGSFSKKENAQSLADNLKKQGMPVFMETIQVAGKGTMYRLRVGPELDKKRAQVMQQKLEQQKIGSILLVE